MKLSKVYLLAQSIITFTSHLCASELLEIIPSKQSNVILNIWNHDVGPVKGGRFMEDQTVVRDHIVGKQCGSGLFQIPKYRNEKKELCIDEGGFPLFDIKISVKVIKTDGTIMPILLSQKLKLPGECTSIDTGLHRSSIRHIKAVLKAFFHGFTTSGGRVWTPLYKMDISEEVMVAQRKIETDSTINLVASWPSEIIGHDLEALLFLEHSPNYEPMITSRDQLDPQWKKTLGLYVHNEDPYAGYGICFPTKDFNRSHEGGTKAVDYYKLGTDFEFYAGHSLDTNPYPKNYQEWEEMVQQYKRDKDNGKSS